MELQRYCLWLLLLNLIFLIFIHVIAKDTILKSYVFSQIYSLCPSMDLWSITGIESVLL